MNVSHKTLKILAASVWYIGVSMLLTKGGKLAQNAHDLEPDQAGLSISWIAGVAIGLIKTRFIFIRSCKRNISRIHRLESPRLWQFYRPRFFLALALMISFGSILSRVSQGNHAFLVAVGVLDISVGIGLLLSSYCFWKPDAFSSVGAESPESRDEQIFRPR